MISPPITVPPPGRREILSSLYWPAERTQEKSDLAARPPAPDAARRAASCASRRRARSSPRARASPPRAEPPAPRPSRHRCGRVAHRRTPESSPPGPSRQRRAPRCRRAGLALPCRRRAISAAPRPFGPSAARRGRVALGAAAATRSDAQARRSVRYHAWCSVGAARPARGAAARARSATPRRLGGRDRWGTLLHTRARLASDVARGARDSRRRARRFAETASRHVFFLQCPGTDPTVKQILPVARNFPPREQRRNECVASEVR